MKINREIFLYVEVTEDYINLGINQSVDITIYTDGYFGFVYNNKHDVIEIQQGLEILEIRRAYLAGEKIE